MYFAVIFQANFIRGDNFDLRTRIHTLAAAIDGTPGWWEEGGNRWVEIKFTRVKSQQQ